MRRSWPFLFYLLGFVGLLILVGFGFIKPAAEAFPHAEGNEKLTLIAFSRLLLMIVLMILFAGLVLTFRAQRFFHHSDEERKPTQYTDAWAEAAKRVKPEDFKE